MLLKNVVFYMKLTLVGNGSKVTRKNPNCGSHKRCSTNIFNVIFSFGKKMLIKNVAPILNVEIALYKCCGEIVLTVSFLNAYNKCWFFTSKIMLDFQHLKWAVRGNSLKLQICCWDNIFLLLGQHFFILFEEQHANCWVRFLWVFEKNDLV